MARGQELLSGHLIPKCPGYQCGPCSTTNLMVAHWGAFAKRVLRNYTRKYMFKFLKIEKRRRAIVMRGNMARRTPNPQYGPFRPIDIHECSSDYDDEPTYSVAPAASDVPTAAPGLHLQPVARIDRALDALSAPSSTRLCQAAGPSTFREEVPIADIHRTTLSGLEAQYPRLHRDIVIELQAMRNRDPRAPESPLMSEPEADDQPGSHGWSIVHAKDCPA